MFRNNIFTILLFGSLCVSVTAVSAEVVFKEDFSGFYATGADTKMTDANNAALNNRDVTWFNDIGTRLVEISTIATYDTTGGLQSVPLTTNPAISASDIPAGRGGNIVNGAFLFPYPTGVNSWKEERFAIEYSALDGRAGLKEVWVQYDRFIPTNYYHRQVVGHWGSKDFALYPEIYGGGNEIIIGRDDSDPLDTGVSYVQGAYEYRETTGGAAFLTGFNDHVNPSINLSTDLGKWQRYTVHVKLPTSYTSNNGIIEIWIRHGNNVVQKHAEVLGGDFLDVDTPWIRHGYILGWSNNGFDTPTSFLITNFILAESVGHIDQAAITYVAPPKPPTGVSVIVN